MLTIRTDQQALLAQPAFEAWLITHVRRFFARECDARGSEGTLAFVREGVRRARAYGLDAGPEICTYIDLAFTFGPDFESAAWAVDLVAEADGHWNEFTVDALFSAAMAELDPSVSLDLVADDSDDTDEAAEDDDSASAEDEAHEDGEDEFDDVFLGEVEIEDDDDDDDQESAAQINVVPGEESQR